MQDRTYYTIDPLGKLKCRKCGVALVKGKAKFMYLDNGFPAGLPPLRLCLCTGGACAGKGSLRREGAGGQMNGHPGGDAHTMRMIELCALSPGARVLDMGAGEGEAVALLRAHGLDAVGIDLIPCGENVVRGDMLHSGYPDEGFDAIISQCAFYVSGDAKAALRESRRLLKDGGVLALSDVFFDSPEALLASSGFSLEHIEDMTEQWREYYFAALWSGETIGCPKTNLKCRYYLIICRKEMPDGSF